MDATTLNTTVPVTIKIQFAPADAFSVRVRTGSSTRPPNRARVIQISAPAWSTVHADGSPSVNEDATTTKG